MRARVRRPALPWLPVTAAAVLLVGCATAPRQGGFYREDGPPEHVPANLLATPDAVPRDEPLNPYANRPYAALGRTYVPDTSDAPFHQRGIASWYGRQFQGNRTASGEPYDMFGMTAAHPTLPIPSYARVTNVRDGRAVIVRINDRGPFVRDRIIDLSYAAAARLGLASLGSGEVEVERIVPAQSAHGLTSPTPAADPIARIAVAADPPPAQPAPSGAGWSVQLGAFKVAANAEALRDRLALLLSSPEASTLPAELRAPRIELRDGLSRVLIGQAAQRAVALQWSQLLERYLARPTALFAR